MVMKCFILYHPNSEQSRSVEEFVHNFSKIYGEGAIDLVSVDTVTGSDKAAVYGIVQYPAVLVVNDIGSIIRSWEGETLPLINELAYYTQTL